MLKQFRATVPFFSQMVLYHLTEEGHCCPKLFQHTIVCLLVLRWKRGRELVHCLYQKLQTCLPTSRRPAKPYLICSLLSFSFFSSSRMLLPCLWARLRCSGVRSTWRWQSAAFFFSLWLNSIPDKRSTALSVVLYGHRTLRLFLRETTQPILWKLPSPWKRYI